MRTGEKCSGSRVTWAVGTGGPRARREGWGEGHWSSCYSRSGAQPGLSEELQR